MLKFSWGRPPEPPYKRGTPPLLLSPTRAFGVRNTKKILVTPLRWVTFCHLGSRKIDTGIHKYNYRCIYSIIDVIIQWIPLNCNPDNGDFRLFVTFLLAPILFPFRQCKIHQIIGTLIKDIFGLLQQKSLHRLKLFLFISNFETYSEFK